MITAKCLAVPALTAGCVLLSFPVLTHAQGACEDGETATQCATSNGWSYVRDWADAHRLKYWGGVISSTWWTDPQGVCDTVRTRTLSVLATRHLGWGRHGSLAGEWYPTEPKSFAMINERMSDEDKLITVVHESTHFYGWSDSTNVEFPSFGGAYDAEACILTIQW